MAHARVFRGRKVNARFRRRAGLETACKGARPGGDPEIIVIARPVKGAEILEMQAKEPPAQRPPALGAERPREGRREDQRKQRQTTKWYVHAYLHADDPAVLPLGEDVLEGLQFGGKRNYGYGEVQLKDTQLVDLDKLDYSRVNGAEAYLIALLTPFVLESEYPEANSCTIPWWWAKDRGELRFREEKILEQREVFQLETVDHGQVVKYRGDCPVETAKNGLQRVGSHSRYGFGELRLKPLRKQYQ